MPDYRSCKRCGKLFDYRGKALCPACMKEKDETYNAVRDYLYEHPEANVTRIVEETGAEKDMVLELLREGSLELRNTSEPPLSCQRCGRAISAGRLCPDCSAGLRRELEGMKRSMMGQPVSRPSESDSAPATRRETVTGGQQGRMHIKTNGKTR